MKRDTNGPAPSIALHNVRFTYGRTLLFHDLNAKIAGGRWTCILGPSGVGKSSLLRLIAGLLESEPGTRIEATDKQPLAGRIAFMAQRDSLMPWLTARENVTLGLRLRGEAVDGAARDQAHALLEAVGLSEKADARPDALSGGQRQRVALARTLMEDRPVVLMDEPFSALDAISRYRIQALAAELLEGRTVLMVTHDPLEALRLGDAVHVMAGVPATLDRPLTLEGAAPRDPAEPDVARQHHALLERLGAAGQAA